MPTRDDQITRFLAGTKTEGWDRQAIAGDASSRRYHRLIGPAATAILMDATPTDGSLSSFLRIDAHLCSLGLAAPEIYSADDAAGLILMEDLGATDFVQHLCIRPADEQVLTDATLDVLDVLFRAPVPDGLGQLTPATGAEMLAPLHQWYAGQGDNDAASAIDAEIEAALASCADPKQTLSLRDFHAGNLIWRPQRGGTDRVGLLDFQDAFVAPCDYDLASYLRDARRDLGDGIADHATDRFARMTGRDPGLVRRSVAVLALQRNLRILGIFARLARRDGKTGYLDLMPRVWRHIRADLGAVGHAPLERAVLSGVPAPDARHLARIAAR